MRLLRYHQKTRSNEPSFQSRVVFFLKMRADARHDYVRTRLLACLLTIAYKQTNKQPTHHQTCPPTCLP